MSWLFNSGRLYKDFVFVFFVSLLLFFFFFFLGGGGGLKIGMVIDQGFICIKLRRFFLKVKVIFKASEKKPVFTEREVSLVKGLFTRGRGMSLMKGL